MNKDEIQKELKESQNKLDDLLKNNSDNLDESFEHEKGYLEGKVMALEIALSSNGDLPSKCPNCELESVNWDWTDNVVYDEQIVNEAQCPKCKTVYEEIMEVIGWNKKEAQS